MQENLKKKYGLTDAQVNSGLDALASHLGSFNNVNIMMAMADLLANGDIKEEQDGQ